MSHFNKAMIIGNLGDAPMVNYTQNNKAVANMSVATTERYKDSNGNQQENTEWHKVTVWGRLAEICRDYLDKGSKVFFEGKLQTEEYEDKQAVTRYTTKIIAYNLIMLDSKNDSSGGQKKSQSKSQPKQQQKPKASQNQPDDDMGMDDDDDLPF